MTTLTIKINERTKAGKAFMAMAEIFFKDAKGVEIIHNPDDLSASTLSDKDEAYLKRLKRSAKQAKEIAQGNRKGKSLNDFLNEV